MKLFEWGLLSQHTCYVDLICSTSLNFCRWFIVNFFIITFPLTGKKFDACKKILLLIYTHKYIHISIYLSIHVFFTHHHLSSTILPIFPPIHSSTTLAIHPSVSSIHLLIDPPNNPLPIRRLVNHLSFYLSIHQPSILYIPFIHWYIHRSTHWSIHISFYQYTYKFFNISIHPCIDLSISTHHQSNIHPLIHSYTYPSIHCPIYQSHQSFNPSIGPSVHWSYPSATCLPMTADTNSSLTHTIPVLSHSCYFPLTNLPMYKPFILTSPKNTCQSTGIDNSTFMIFAFSYVTKLLKIL